MIGELCHQHMCQQAWPGDATRDGPARGEWTQFNLRLASTMPLADQPLQTVVKDAYVRSEGAQRTLQLHEESAVFNVTAYRCKRHAPSGVVRRRALRLHDQVARPLPLARSVLTENALPALFLRSRNGYSFHDPRPSPASV